MNITQMSLKNPIGVMVVLVFIVLFGIVAVVQTPIQLFPDIESPSIAISTQWRAAAPSEIESEIVEPQEEVLRGLPGLKELNAFASRGSAWINLEFAIETDMQQTMLEVISRMTRLPPLPRDATPPRIMLGGWGNGAPALTYFFLQTLPGNTKGIQHYTTLVDDVIKPQLESIEGVSSISLESGAEPIELQIQFDPNKLVEYRLTLPELLSRISGQNDASGGTLKVGRRQYTLRFIGSFDPETLGDLILEWRNNSPIRLKDVATVGVMPRDRSGLAIQNGNPAFSIRINRENGANVLDTLNNVKRKIEQLNQEVLLPEKLVMVQSFDASVFINRAIQLVSSNLVIGVLLAIVVLWFFLRRMRATVLVALAIPISLLSTLIVLQITGRSINVISLAGIAFAVGMVLDAAIVVVENILRLQEKSQNLNICCEQGTTEVWGALLASTATTIAIFLPVFFLKDIEGQLFGDLALTIAISVFVSLLVAVSVIPLVAKYCLQELPMDDQFSGLWHRISRAVMRLTSNSKKRWSLLSIGLVLPLLVTWLALPSLDYLPPVKRDAVDAFFDFPAGINLDTVEKEVVAPIIQRLKPYMDGEREPSLKNYYLIVADWGATLGIRAKDQSRVDELVDLVNNEILKDLPDTETFANQGNLFGGFGGEENVQINLQARDMNELMATANEARDWIEEAIPGTRVRSNPPLIFSEPELRLTPDDRKIIEQGWTRRDLATIVRSLGAGQYVGEHFDGNQRIDMIVRGNKRLNPDSLADVPLLTPNGNVLPLGDLIDIQRTVGPTRLNRLDGRRNIRLGIQLPQGWSLEQAVQILKTEVEPKIKSRLPVDGNIVYGGSADQLEKAVATMGQNFLFALFVLLILMGALFRSIKDSLLVIFTIPLATVGGVLALRVLNLFAVQPLDLLTMIGFVILLGLVVNNAILLVHQTRMSERQGLSRHRAVEQALRTRLRPIFMSTLTSLFGMLPLLLLPGAGSVIYRGLAAVIVGGMTVSGIFTIILLPCLLRMGENSLRLLKNHSVKADQRLETAA